MFSTHSYAQNCWREFNPAKCRTTIISEFSVSSSYLNDLRTGNYGFAPGMHINLGANRIINSKYAIGGVTKFDYIYNKPAVGLGPRFSYFPNNKWEANITPGLFLYGGNVGVNLETSINWKNNIGLFIRGSITESPYRDGKYDASRFYLATVGINSRGVVAPIAFVGTSLTLLAILVVGFLLWAF